MMVRMFVYITLIVSCFYVVDNFGKMCCGEIPGVISGCVVWAENQNCPPGALPSR